MRARHHPPSRSDASFADSGSLRLTGPGNALARRGGATNTPRPSAAGFRRWTLRNGAESSIRGLPQNERVLPAIRPQGGAEGTTGIGGFVYFRLADMTKKSITENAWLEGTLHAATGVRFYAVDFLPMDPTALGMSYGCTDLAARDGLQRAGRWDGRRTAVTLNRDSITRLAYERSEPAGFDVERRRLLLAVAVHEASHALDSEPPYFSPTPPAGNHDRQSAVTRLALTLRPPGIVTAACPWFGHGPRWWRMLFHLAYRAEQLTGINLPAAVLSMGRYELPPPAVIRRAFGSEPRRFRHLSIEAIKQRSYSRKFRRLWASSVHRHVAAETRRARNHGDEMMNTFFEGLRRRIGAQPDRFDDLARRVATDESIDPAEAESILSASGRTVNDLQEAVEGIRERRRLQGIVRDAAKLEKRRDSLARKMRILTARQERELERLAEKHLTETDPLETELDDVQRQLSEANEARRRLHKLAAEKHSELSREVRAAEHRAGQLWQTAYELQDLAAEDSTRYEAAHHRAKQDAADARAEADRLAGDLAERIEADSMA